MEMFVQAVGQLLMHTDNCFLTNRENVPLVERKEKLLQCQTLFSV